MTDLAALPTTRRERMREQTVEEIKGVARRLLVTDGIAGVQLRAIARELGLTAPALYRYFDSHEALLGDLVGDLYGELAEAIETASGPGVGDVGVRLLAAARAFRAWAVTHPAEFTLLFGSPIPGVEVAQDSAAHTQARRFGQAFGNLYVELWHTAPFPVPQHLPTAYEPVLQEYADKLGIDMPPGAIAVYLSSWVRLYGTVTMEVFGHVSFALADTEPIFEAEIASLGQLLGLPRHPAG